MLRPVLRRVPTALAAVAVAAAGSTIAPVAAEAASSTCSVSDGITTCTFIDSTAVRSFDQTYAVDFVNSKSYAISGSCKSDKSETNTYSVSITVSAEAKAWVFAKISASVTGGVQKSVTAAYGSSVSFSVPAHSTVHCQYGIYDYTVHGHTTTTVKGSSSTKYWTAVAPQREVWLVS